jgi:hypothetical protein
MQFAKEWAVVLQVFQYIDRNDAVELTIPEREPVGRSPSHWLLKECAHLIDALRSKFRPTPVTAAFPKMPIERAVVVATCDEQAALARRIPQLAQQRLELEPLLE